jgi:hypothetical protein
MTKLAIILSLCLKRRLHLEPMDIDHIEGGRGGCTTTAATSSTSSYSTATITTNAHEKTGVQPSLGPVPLGLDDVMRPEGLVLRMALCRGQPPGGRYQALGMQLGQGGYHRGDLLLGFRCHHISQGRSRHRGGRSRRRRRRRRTTTCTSSSSRGRRLDVIDVRTSAQGRLPPPAVGDDAQPAPTALPPAASAQHSRRPVPPDVALLLVVAEPVADVGRDGIGGEDRVPVRLELRPLARRQRVEGVRHEETLRGAFRFFVAAVAVAAAAAALSGGAVLGMIAGIIGSWEGGRGSGGSGARPRPLDAREGRRRADSAAAGSATGSRHPGWSCNYLLRRERVLVDASTSTSRT